MAHWRICPWLARLWPRTLFGRLLVIMLSGTLAIQLLSSSIWFDVRFAQVLEAPVRLIASRTALLLEQQHCQTIESLRMPAGYQVSCLDAAPDQLSGNHRARRRTELLLAQSLAREVGQPQPVRVLDVHLTDQQGQPVVWRSFFGLQTAIAHVKFVVPLADGSWLQVDSEELQGWSGESAWSLIADYALRVYVLRILAVLAICWIAVRLCLRPLERMSEAARGLGTNLEQAPLAIEGPQEVRQAAQTFNAMQQRLIAMVSDQSYFLAAVSHDLRTPLTRMRLRVETLDNQKQRERLKQNIAQMDLMIGQVLDYLKSAEQQACQMVDLDQLIKRLCADLATQDEPLPVLGRGGVIYANEVLVHRGVQNLLVNALRYARQVVVSLDRGPKGVSIRVKDMGPGIAAHVLESIGDRPLNGKPPANPQSGSYGLGLSIARRIAMIHEGSLTLSNREEGGLTAQFYLPLGNADHRPAE
jgi:signal transduction histidine kinase